MLRLAFLGRPRIIHDGSPVDDFVSNKAVALLAYLATNEGDHARERLAGMLWGEKPPKRANANLRMALYSIRQNLPESYFTVTRKRAGFDHTQPYWLDTEVLTDALKNASQAPEQLAEAIDLYRGDFLAGLYFDDAPAFQEWVLTRRERLRLQMLSGLRQLIEHYKRAGSLDDAIEATRTLLDVDPLREGTHRTLMELLTHAGRYNEALQQYERCREVLREELGIDPMPETQALYERIKSMRARSPAAGLGTGLDHDTSERTEEPSTVFVDREEELNHLHDALDGALAGSGQVRFVIGEAGSGKSALVHEFARRAQIQRSDLLIAVGAGTGYAGSGDPYAPFRAVLRQLTGDVAAAVTDGRVSHQMARRLRAAALRAIRTLVDAGSDLIGSFVSGQRLCSRAQEVAATDTDWLIELEGYIDEGTDDDLDQTHLFEQYTRVVRKVAAQTPLCIVIDDLHWVDTSSLHLLFHLGQHVDQRRILLIGTYRPEEIALHNEQHPLADAAAEFKRQYGDIWINLDDSSAEKGRAFVDAYLDAEPNALDEEFRQALYRQTRGHPLFVRELLRDLEDRGDLQRNDSGHWITSTPIDWDILPSKAEGVIETRVRRLSDELQEALTVASVEGEEFTAEVIAEVQGVETPTLIQHLSKDADQTHRLIRQQGIHHVGGSRLSRYRFRHNLFRTYLYSQLGDVERAHLHGQVGDALESLYGDASLAPHRAATSQGHATGVVHLAVGAVQRGDAGAHSTQLAHHFQQAGRLEKAITYLSQAGQQARRVAANEEAIDHFTQALALLERLPASTEHMQQELRLRVAYGNALMAARGFAVPEIEENFLRARELCRHLDEVETLFPVLYALHMYHGVGGRYEPALRYGDEFLTASKEQGHMGAQVVAHRTLSIILFLQGKFEQAHEHLQELLALYEPAKHYALAQHYGQDPGVAGLVAGAWTVWMLGYPEQALQLTRRAFTILDEWPDAHTRAYALVFTAALHHFRREPALVRDHIEPAIELAQEKNFRFWLAVAQTLHGWCLARTGPNVEVGIEKLQTGIEMMQAAGTQSTATFFRGMLADIYRRENAIDAGLNTIGAALADSEARGERFWVAELHRLRGELLRDAGSRDSAEDCFREAMRVADVQSARTLELRAAVSLGRLLCERGDEETARTLVAKKYEWFDEGHETPDLREAHDFIEELS